MTFEPTMSAEGRYDVRGHGLSFRLCEVRMEDGTWEPGVVKQDTTTVAGHAALITWEGITAWLYREGGSGHVNEWRYPEKDGATDALRRNEPSDV